MLTRSGVHGPEWATNVVKENVHCDELEDEPYPRNV